MTIIESLNQEKQRLLDGLETERMKVSEKIEEINKMLDLYGEPVEAPNGISKTEQIKQALRKIEDKAYHINELQQLLEVRGLNVKRQLIHQALRAMREDKKMIAFKLNGSNMSVYYMKPEGIGQDPDYPVEYAWRPIPKAQVSSFEWLDPI